MNLYDIYYLVFRNKWLILAGLSAGVISACVLFFYLPDNYRSEAKLLVRYVSDTVIADPQVTGDRVVTPGRQGETIINTEIDILSSSELIATAAAAVSRSTNGISGPPVSGSAIAANFRVNAAKNSNKIGRAHV